MSIERNKALDLHSKATDIIKSCKFLGSEEDNAKIREAETLFKQASEINASWDKSLVALCSLEMRVHKRPTELVLQYSHLALRRVPSADALTYYCKTTTFLYDPFKARKMLDEVAPLLRSNPDLENLLNIFYGIVAYNQSNFALYCKFLERARTGKRHDFNHYVFTQSSTSNQYNSVIEFCKDRTPYTGFVESFEGDRLPHKCQAIISVSSDPVYLLTYGETFIGSFAKKVEDNIGCYLTVVCPPNQDNSWKDYLYSLIEKYNLSHRFVISQVNIPNDVNIGPISSLARLINAKLIRDNRDCKVIVLDFDSVFINKLEKLLLLTDKFDIAMRVLKNVAPWEKLTGGISIFNNTSNANTYLQALYDYAVHIIDLDQVQWWVDQNCIEAAWRHCATMGPAVDYIDIFEYRDKYIIQPTGTKEYKLATLNKFFNL